MFFILTDLITVVMGFIQFGLGEGSEDPILAPHAVIAAALIRKKKIINELVLVFVFIQHILGITIKLLLEDISGKNREIALKLRKGHAILGTLLLIAGKIDVIIGMFLNAVGVLAVLVLLWHLILLIIWIVFEVNNRLGLSYSLRLEDAEVPK